MTLQKQKTQTKRNHWEFLEHRGQKRPLQFGKIKVV